MCLFNADNKAFGQAWVGKMELGNYHLILYSSSVQTEVELSDMM